MPCVLLLEPVEGERPTRAHELHDLGALELRVAVVDVEVAHRGLFQDDGSTAFVDETGFRLEEPILAKVDLHEIVRRDLVRLAAVAVLCEILNDDIDRTGTLGFKAHRSRKEIGQLQIRRVAIYIHGRLQVEQVVLVLAALVIGAGGLQRAVIGH